MYSDARATAADEAEFGTLSISMTGSGHFVAKEIDLFVIRQTPQAERVYRLYIRPGTSADSANTCAAEYECDQEHLKQHVGAATNSPSCAFPKYSCALVAHSSPG